MGGQVEEIIDGLRNAVEAKALYEALALALAIPDICARIETPDVGSAARYSRWWNDNAADLYSHPGWGDGPYIFLTGNDVYALRCALLHEGQADITEQRARHALERFVFTEDTQQHCNQIDKVLQLSVARFCVDVANAATAWVAKRRKDGQPAEPEAVIAIFPLGSSFVVNGVHFAGK